MALSSENAIVKRENLSNEQDVTNGKQNKKGGEILRGIGEFFGGVAGGFLSSLSDDDEQIQEEETALAEIQEKDLTVGESSEEIVNIDDFEKLGEIVAKSRNEILSAKDGETAVSYALKAQLQVLQVVESPALNASMFDLMLESVYLAIENAEDEKQKKLIQQKAALMVNSMIFFMEAKIYVEENKWKKEGMDLLERGCIMLADSASVIVDIASPSIKIVIDGGKLFETLIQNRTLFNRIVTFFAENPKEKIKKMKIDFNEFVYSAVEKLDKYKTLFGKSIVLAELIDRSAQVVIEKKIEMIQKPSAPHKPTEEEFMPKEIKLYDFELGEVIKTTVFWVIGILVFMFIVLGVMKLIDLLPFIDWERGRYWVWAVLKFGSLTLPASLLVIFLFKFIGFLQYKTAKTKAGKLLDEAMLEYKTKVQEYNVKIEEYDDECDKVKNYYQSLSSFFRFETMK